MIPLVAPLITEKDMQWMSNAVMAGRTNILVDDEREVRKFEEEFAEYVGCAGAVAVNSGTNALVVALTALGRADEAIWFPSFSCRALLNAVYSQGGTPDLFDNHCDIARANFSARIPSYASIALIPHMFGTAPIDYTGIGQSIVEDLTLSLGAARGRGVFPAVCSFHRDKMITTGRGGIIVAQDQEFLDECRELAYYDQPRNGTYRPAFSFGMTAMQAALGRSQLRQLPRFIERRREIAARYTAAFSEMGIECPDPGVDSVFFRYIIGVADPAGKVSELAERGVEAGRGVNPPLHRLLGLPNDQFPGAEECFAKLLSVPVHPGLTDEQVQYIIVQVLEVCAP